MSDKYKIRDESKPYFLTLTIEGWIDIFTKKNFKLLIIDSLRYCQKEKGLAIYGYCIMPNHLHIIARAEGDIPLSSVIRDFKKFTSKAIIRKLHDDDDSRKEWILEYFREVGSKSKKIRNYKVWQDGNHAEVIDSNRFFDQKLEYIHYNPVKELIVEKPEEYIFSSARKYAGLDNYLDVILESVKMNTYK